MSRPGHAEAAGSISPPGRSAAPDDGHGGPEPWQNWSEDKKLQRQLSMGGHLNHQHRIKLNTIMVVTALRGPTMFSTDLGTNVNAFHDKQNIMNKIWIFSSQSKALLNE